MYGQYATRIVGSILFHSVPYTKQNPANLEYWEYDKLGTKASAGCIRLTVIDAKWIYDNCKSGTKVEFYSDSNPGPLGKPTAQKISDADENVRVWDPTDPRSDNPWKTYNSNKVENTTEEKNENEQIENEDKTNNTQNKNENTATNTKPENTPVKDENSNAQTENKPQEDEKDTTQTENKTENKTEENTTNNTQTENKTDEDKTENTQNKNEQNTKPENNITEKPVIEDNKNNIDVSNKTEEI